MNNAVLSGRTKELMLFNPIFFSISARQPQRYNVLSAWIGHVPFGMALMAMVKPRTLVELGTHWGVSYCGFCQAVKELRLPTKCYAVDTWKGDAHSAFYTEDVFEDLKRHHDQRYSLFSRLIRSTFDEALDSFDDASIDVLHIDGYHTYEAVKRDFETWQPKMSDAGIVLFHDTEVRDRETYGVWRFWDEIKQKFPYFEFLHSHGLGVLAVGRTIPEELAWIMDSSCYHKTLIQQYFAFLGERLVEMNSLAMQQANLEDLLEVKARECQQLEMARVQIATELERLRRQSRKYFGFGPIVHAPRDLSRVIRRNFRSKYWGLAPIVHAPRDFSRFIRRKTSRSVS